MKEVWQLKNPDIIEINGKKYQVLNRISAWTPSDSPKLNWIIELTIPNGKRIFPGYDLKYSTKSYSFNILGRLKLFLDKKFREPEEIKWKFSALNRKTKRWKKVKVKSFKFPSA